ncbi:hypothetical protein HN682_02260 [Candidatus Peregrinibacteria bacterium]|jgi:hypothetical protein|nr:hypothetical protein [Candidatus Peregrinibacteria bacterium]
MPRSREPDYGGWKPDGKTPMDEFVTVKEDQRVDAQDERDAIQAEDPTQLKAPVLLQLAREGNPGAQEELTRRRLEESQDADHHNNPGYSKAA